ncbi:uncharacterized protein [Apostichopus japonicus]|uniref:uncharacterized protein n=1 Tax=Stichopus japonicus TaxID=307972 RepID=UPI003AB6D11D
MIMHVYFFLGSLSFIHCCMSISTPCAKTTYLDKYTTAVIGQNVTLECGICGNCSYFTWFIYLANTSRIDLSVEQCNKRYKTCHTTADNGRNVLRLTDIDNSVAGYYQCLCAIYSLPYAFGCEQLFVFCQFEVFVKNVSMFNSSNVVHTQTDVINVTEGEDIRVNCPNTSYSHNCSEDSSKTFTAAGSHQTCYIECNCSRIGATGVTINVLQRETTTTSTSTTASVRSIASTKALASYSKEQMTDACNCIPVVAFLLVSVSILVLVVCALTIYIRYLKFNGFPKPVSTNEAIFSQPADATVNKYVNADAGKAATCHISVPHAEAMVSPMSTTDNLEVNCSASTSYDANCDASGYEIPKNMDCTNEIKYDTIT